MHYYKRVRLETRCGCSREMTLPVSYTKDTIEVPMVRRNLFWREGDVALESTFIVDRRVFEYERTTRDDIEVYTEKVWPD